MFFQLRRYDARRANGALRFRCKGCKKEFTITSGTLFASHKLPLKNYLAAIAVFSNEVKGKSALALRPRPRISESAFIGGFIWWDSAAGMMLVAYPCD